MNIIPFHNCRSLKYPIGHNLQDSFAYIDEVLPFVQSVVGSRPVNVWCRGSSGAILATLLIKGLDNTCYIQHVKKEGESAHDNGLRYNEDDRLNIIIDDFCRSGSTLNAIWREAKHYQVEAIDLLILANAYRDEWPLDFKPLNLIIDEDSIHHSWRITDCVSTNYVFPQ